VGDLRLKTFSLRRVGRKKEKRKKAGARLPLYPARGKGGSILQKKEKLALGGRGAGGSKRRAEGGKGLRERSRSDTFPFKGGERRGSESEGNVELSRESFS